MKNYDHYSGIFLPTNKDFVGHLSVASAETIAKLTGKNHWPRTNSEYEDIHGILANGTKASLLDCLHQGRTRYRLDENTQFESTLLPNYVVVGESFITADEPVIQAIHYHFDNVTSLLSGLDTFRSFIPDRDTVYEILQKEHQRWEKPAGVPIPPKKRPFKPEIGEHPHLLYFSGVWEVIAANAKLGKISLTNRTTHNMGSAAGIGIENEVTANIEFTEPQTLRAAVRALSTLHDLFEFSLGHRQRYKWIELELTHLVEDREHDMHQTAQLYWSMCNTRVEYETKTHPADVLLAPGRRPDEFSAVTASWMDSASVMSDPRGRFATAFFGHYGINRIVGAANMFDLLPESHAPKKKENDTQTKEAVRQCREIFAALPNNSAKQSVLSALGRVGIASLRDKVYHRADKIISLAGSSFPEMYLPCSEAVLARNHYVHGSPASFDYHKNFTELAFITDTLEFVFGASDLIDLGWDLKSWVSERRPGTHAFAAYLIDYSENIRRLKTLLGS